MQLLEIAVIDKTQLLIDLAVTTFQERSFSALSNMKYVKQTFVMVNRDAARNTECGVNEGILQ